ncbi:Ig-like domain-containing protein [Pseudonocardia alaniniphila]|uniref:Ig-like domain-containing protein n=1 Tax=Pseudonocardia alaniniphila TaxID=75291 RepID=A0ABS9TGI4_9PSEU|nr:Ig-like domain-containing protein [Pseudonocardia alaniniphila]MCH6167391.1 Ig-like domain-containing protein [Pseudonocardia alaniniphila]
MAISALLAFAPQASAQPAQSSTVAGASPAAAAVGERVVLTATVTCPGSPEGGLGVTFFDGPNLLATAPVDAEGNAELATSFVTTGTHDITAAYNGNDNCGASYDETTVEISDAPPPTPPSGGLISFDRIANGNTFNNIGNNY